MQDISLNFNVAGDERKKLVKAVGAYKQVTPEYLGVPSFAFRIDEIIIDKDGILIIEDGMEPDKFEEFLNRSGIYLKSYQREIIKCMHNPYIACKKGERDLIIKKSYEMLKNELTIPSPQPTPSTLATPRGSEDREPYNVAITRPPMVFEPDSRYPEYMDCCGRGHMQGEFWDW